MAKPRILLVDDEPLLLRSLSRVFGTLYDLTTAGHVAEAVAALESSQRFAILICDLSLGHERGTDVLAAARRLRPTMPRVLLSSALEAELQAVVTAGLAHLALGKTISPRKMLEQVGALLTEEALA